MTYRLGINKQHTSSIALEKNGLLLEIISEERITGRKSDDTFPLKSIFYLIEKYNIKDFKRVIFCSSNFNIFREFPRKIFFLNLPLFMEFLLDKYKDLFNLKEKPAYRNLNLDSRFFLDNIHIPVEEFGSEEHHLCHARAAYMLLKDDHFNGGSGHIY